LVGFERVGRWMESFEEVALDVGGVEWMARGTGYLKFWV
jgi:hypothetical protein